MRIKRIELSIYGPRQRLIRRMRIVPPRKDLVVGGVETAKQWPINVRQYFTDDGAEEALYRLIVQLDEKNPGNQWRLVRIGFWQYKLVWEDPAELDAAKAKELGLDEGILG